MDNPHAPAAPPLEPVDDHRETVDRPPAEPVDDRPISPTGGERGRPEAEHGAYGMVRDDAPPLLSEREIRGVEPAAPDEGRP